MRSSDHDAVCIRGAILAPVETGRVHCIDDGEVVIGGDGRLQFAGERDRRRNRTGNRDIDLGEPVVVMPGLVDAHVHLPQRVIRGLDPGPLLDWLATMVYPVERRYADHDHALAGAVAFERDLVRLGTTTAGVYVTSHTTATRLALERLRLGGVVGKVLMDRAAPDDLTEPASDALPALTSLIDVHGSRAAVVPRFAVGCTAELLGGAGDLARRRGARIMTHLAETLDEVAEVASLFPEAASYTDVYARAGLLGPRTLLAHAIHLDDGEFRLLAASGSMVVHCPTANESLGSGRMAVESFLEHGVPYVLGTDVGAGPSLSMWHVIDAYLRVQDGRAGVDAEGAFWRATRGGALALGERDGGRLTVGAPADLTVFPLPAGVHGAEAIVRSLAAVTATDPEPEALSTWCRGRPVHERHRAG